MYSEHTIREKRGRRGLVDRTSSLTGSTPDLLDCKLALASKLIAHRAEGVASSTEKIKLCLDDMPDLSNQNLVETMV